ncbi:hypothetical protein MKX53_13160 [Psychrobacillus sp. FSL K6-4615]|uniref:hypothetical protein n=1 Tax=Psychrobacillus sp. FSL K6-4615 TaxID=2921551 RepID=UPI0030F73DC1
MKFKVKRKDLVFDNTVGTYEVKLKPDGSYNDGLFTLSLDKSSNYYIEFAGPNEFNGYIE